MTWKTPEAVADLLEGEGPHVEWKQGGSSRDSSVKAGFRSLVAMANDLQGSARAGAVVFGVNEARVQEGERSAEALPGLTPKEADNLIQALSGWARAQPKPPIELSFERVQAPNPRRCLLVARVQPQGELHLLEGEAPVRAGSSTLDARRVSTPSPHLPRPPCPA